MDHGKFSGEPAAVWITEEGTPDRKMRLLEDFYFIDPALKKWPAPAKSVVDGASIPRALWTIVGSPYTGDYRRASIVHDVACDDVGSNKPKRLAADRMFYHACRAGGCSAWQSTVLYVGVRIGAAIVAVDTWNAAAATESLGPRIRRTDEELRLERDFQAIAERVLAPGEVDDPRVLESRVHGALLAVVGLRQGSGRRPRRGRPKK